MTNFISTFDCIINHLKHYVMEYHRISFIYNDTDYSFVKAIKDGLTGYALMLACRVEVQIFMSQHNLKGNYILTGMAKV